GVALIDIHRAELVDLDQLVVETVAFLLEEHRPATVELDRKSGDEHDRRQTDQRQTADDLVEQPLGDDVPVGDRLVGDIEYRHAADIGVSARPESQLVAAARRMSIGSTHSFLSICRMRLSAEIGSEKMTRSIRVLRANSTRSSTVPSFWWPPMLAWER